ncbi:Fructose-2, 6-bisphosphatase TIGAR [Sarcoptes scabiei]|nr:Fructose-2, 6-bisphosphatase TIGAR [Sarcoptes scabiei]
MSFQFHLTLISGETDENVQSIIQGCMDTKLNQTGRNQAKSLASSSKFNPCDFNIIYSSDLSRAYDTCRILTEDRADIICDKLLRERNFGNLEGSPISKLSSLAAASGVSIVDYTAGGGESLADVAKRAEQFIENRLLKEVQSGQQVLLVSHGGLIRQMIIYLKKFGNFSQVHSKKALHVPPNTSQSKFKIFYDHSKIVKVECIEMHDISHLSGEAKQKALEQHQINP